jgi:hypothetical protein
MHEYARDFNSVLVDLRSSRRKLDEALDRAMNRDERQHIQECIVTSDENIDNAVACRQMYEQAVEINNLPATATSDRLSQLDRLISLYECVRI